MSERFGPYELTELLGRGGMGEVWRAVDTRKSRTVALKRLPEDMTGEREFEDRFRREAHAAARLSDPHVIPIHDYGEIEGRLFLDMRLVEGQDLGTLIEERGAMAPARAVSIVEQVASALDAAHDDGLVHRDVKPSNVLLTPSKRTVGPDDFVYLIDFGIATGAALGTRLTQTGMAIGTAAYMAPERFTDGEDADPRIDVYALGCVLHEALTGRPPFTGRDFPSLMYQHINTVPTPPSRSAASLPRGFDEVVARALTKDRERRYPRAGDLAAAARRALGTEPAPGAPRHVDTQVPVRTPSRTPPQPAPVDRPMTRAGAAPRPVTGLAPGALPPRPPSPPWRPPPPQYVPPPMVRPPSERGGRIAAAITAIPFLGFLILMCIAGASAEFPRCGSRAMSCAAGGTSLVAMAVAIVGIGVAIAGLTPRGRLTRRRAGLAWALFGGGLALFFLTGVLATI